MNSRAKIVRYISEGSFTANESPMWMMKKAMHIVNIIGMRQRRNRAPRMKPNEHTISANSTSHNDRELPIPMGSGNVSGNSLYACIFAIPCDRNRAPKMMRAKSNTTDFVDDVTGSLNSDFSNFLYIICGVFFV